MATNTNLHPRNLHNEGYDFARLIAALPELGPFTGLNPAGQTTIGFRDVAAVRMLNRALLKADYGIDSGTSRRTTFARPFRGASIISTIWPICWHAATTTRSRAGRRSRRWTSAPAQAWSTR